MLSRFVFAALFAVCLLFSPAVYAQEKEPSLPAPLQALKDEGAQMRYLGAEGGLDGWISIKGGQEQYFYVTPDGQAIIMGVMFNKDGKMITMRQVRKLQQDSGSSLAMLADDGTLQAPGSKADDAGAMAAAAAGSSSKPATMEKFKTPAEQMMDTVEQANWVPLGNANAPFIYTFVDPQCPHCHDFIMDLKEKYIDTGLLQVRIIPVGFTPDSLAQAAFLLAVPSPQDRFFKHLAGDKTALPVLADVNQQGVQRNLAIMQTWNFNVTPLTVYRAADGQVKIVQGRATDPQAIINDLQ